MFKAPLKMLNPLFNFATQEKNFNGTEAIGAMLLMVGWLIVMKVMGSNLNPNKTNGKLSWIVLILFKFLLLKIFQRRS